MFAITLERGISVVLLLCVLRVFWQARHSKKLNWKV